MLTHYTSWKTTSGPSNKQPVTWIYQQHDTWHGDFQVQGPHISALQSTRSTDDPSTKGNKEWKRFTNNVRCICRPNAALITENDVSRYRLPCFEIRALFSLVSAVNKLRNTWLGRVIRSGEKVVYYLPTQALLDVTFHFAKEIQAFGSIWNMNKNIFKIKEPTFCKELQRASLNSSITQGWRGRSTSHEENHFYHL